MRSIPQTSDGVVGISVGTPADLVVDGSSSRPLLRSRRDGGTLRSGTESAYLRRRIAFQTAKPLGWRAMSVYFRDPKR